MLFCQLLLVAFFSTFKNCFQGATALTIWLLTCIMFVFSAVMAYTFILSKNIIRFIKIRLHQTQIILLLIVSLSLGWGLLNHRNLKRWRCGTGSAPWTMISSSGSLMLSSLLSSRHVFSFSMWDTGIITSVPMNLFVCIRSGKIISRIHKAARQTNKKKD